MDPHKMAQKLAEKCGISYDEAMSVLRDADYDIFEAMLILERQGRLGGSSHGRYSTGIMDNYVSASDGKSAADAETMGEFLRIAWDSLKDVMRSVLSYYLIISRDNREIASLPIILAAVILFGTMGIGPVVLIISLVKGFSYSIRKK